MAEEEAEAAEEDEGAAEPPAGPIAVDQRAAEEGPVRPILLTGLGPDELHQLVGPVREEAAARRRGSNQRSPVPFEKQGTSLCAGQLSVHTHTNTHDCFGRRL